jgi:glycerol-3-phosphate dehydrogenase (NAD(P)+)
MKTTVIGAGAWGTALSRLLFEGGNPVTLWGRNPAHLEEIRRNGRNERHLPGIAIPDGVRFEADLQKAALGADCLVVALPSSAFRDITARLPDYAGVVVSVTKGIEHDTGCTMCGVLAETIPLARVAAISGPNLAQEIARGVPAATVAASHDSETARLVQALFHRAAFRVYTSQDLIGVELGGALKNVIAIAAGVCDGLGFGDNSKAALVTRAIVEMRRLGVACGAHAETFAGLSGLGDLAVTCFSKLSRNRGLGERLGRGDKLADILPTSVSVAEGYPTALSAQQLALKHHVDAPIVSEVHALLYEGKSPAKAVLDIISRESKAEA